MNPEITERLAIKPEYLEELRRHDLQLAETAGFESFRRYPPEASADGGS